VHPSITNDVPNGQSCLGLHSHQPTASSLAHTLTLSKDRKEGRK